MKKSNQLPPKEVVRKRRLPPQLSEIPFFAEFLENFCTSTDFDYAYELVFAFQTEVADFFGKQIGCSTLAKNLINEMHIKNTEFLTSGIMPVAI